MIKSHAQNITKHIPSKEELQFCDQHMCSLFTDGAYVKVGGVVVIRFYWR